MIINGNIQAVTGAYNVSTASGMKRTSAMRETHESDAVVFSNEAQSFSSMLQKLKSMDDSREQKIAALRQQVADGSYQVDAQKLAGSLLDTRY